MVYYRTYRPQTIAELDSPKLRETLYSVLKGAVQNTDSVKPVKQADSLANAQSVPHAFLFTGPKGLGKTSTARIIAKVLNCTAKKRNGIEPCNECEECVSITNGNNIDVLEIDGASNRGIDEIRELRERVNLAPSASRKKVYIIDEVHMLTTEAFNALLKTIEEPPSHVVFIFATTEPQKVPATIISRCFHISLDKATRDELIHALRRIVKNEKLDVDDETLGLIADMGDGGYRDATKILEELVALSNGKKITKQFFEQEFKISGVQFAMLPFFASLEKREVKEALQLISGQLEQGIDMKYFVSQCLEALHELLLLKMEVLQATKYQLPSNLFTIGQIDGLISLFSEAYQQTKFAVITSLPLELAVVKWCQQASSMGNEVTPESNQEQDSGQARMTNVQDNTKSRMTVKDAIKKEQNLKVKQVLGKAEPVAKQPVSEPTHKQEDLPKDIQDKQMLLENLIYKVKPYNHSVAGVLRSCIVQSVSDTGVIFQTAYEFHKERLEDNKSREILEKGLKEITGKNLAVSIVLVKK